MSGFFHTVTIIVVWYASNIGVLLLNKFLLTNTGFKQPVFLTLCHMTSCATFSFIFSWAGIFPAKPIKSKAQLFKVLLLSTLFCITIVLGNVSLKYIPVSFNQAIGATTPFFTALLALLLQGQKEHAVTYSTLIPVVVGVIMASGGEPSFHIVGFLTAILATAGRAFKSVVQAMIMSDPNEKLDAMSLLMYMSFFSIMMLIPTTWLLEPTAIASALRLSNADKGFILWLLMNSSLAYLVNLFNFLVTKHTSALTLQVLGNGKGVVAAIVSVLIFHNPVTWKGCWGYAVTVTGVFLYSEAKRRYRVNLPKHDTTDDMEMATENYLTVKDQGQDQRFKVLVRDTQASNKDMMRRLGGVDGSKA